MIRERVDLEPIGEAPDRTARWCPSCAIWITNLRGRRRCGLCHTAVIRPSRRVVARPGELRPGIVAEFHDPRDADVGREHLAAARRKLQQRGAA